MWINLQTDKSTDMIKMTIRISAALLLAAVIFSCGGSGGRTTDGESAGMRYARYLSISDCGSYTVADITNPWDTARLPGHARPHPH